MSVCVLLSDFAKVIIYFFSANKKQGYTMAPCKVTRLL